MQILHRCIALDTFLSGHVPHPFWSLPFWSGIVDLEVGAGFMHLFWNARCFISLHIVPSSRAVRDFDTHFPLGGTVLVDICSP